MKKIRNYIIYTLIIGTIYGLLSPIISNTIVNQAFFDWQGFTFVIIMALIVAVLSFLFPKFRKAGDP
jgi:H+/Cl- antiporter ClcA